MRNADLTGTFQKKRNALIAIDRAERSSGDSNPIEVRRRLDTQRSEFGWHRQNVR